MDIQIKRSRLRVSNSTVFSSGYLIHELIPDDDNHVAQNEQIVDLRDKYIFKYIFVDFSYEKPT